VALLLASAKPVAPDGVLALPAVVAGRFAPPVVMGKLPVVIVAVALVFYAFLFCQTGMFITSS